MMTKAAIIDILGDICISNYQGTTDSFFELVTGINGALGKVDFRVVNFEGVVDGDRYAPIVKDGPNLSMDGALSDVLVKNLDVDAFCLANNHIGDFGPVAASDTMNFLTEHQKEVFGLESRRGVYTPLFKDISGLRIAFLAVCENEFGTSGDGVIGASGYVEADLLKSVSNAKKESGAVIVLFHGGVEYYPFPTPQMRKRYRNLIDAGADIVVGMHQHCPCGYEKYKDGIISYGLGNFLFPDISFYEDWNVGYIARFHIGETTEFEPVPYCIDGNGNVALIDKDIFDGYLERISKPIQDDGNLVGLLDAFCLLGGYKAERILRNIGKNFNARKSAAIKNLFSCESHRELTIRYFEKRINADKEDAVDDECMTLLKSALNCKKSLGLQAIRDEKRVRGIGDTHVIWGLNIKAKRVFKEIRQQLPEAEIILTDKSQLLRGMSVLGTTISDPESILKENPDYKYHICVNKAHFEDVDKILTCAGISKENVIWHE